MQGRSGDRVIWVIWSVQGKLVSAGRSSRWQGGLIDGRVLAVFTGTFQVVWRHLCQFRPLEKSQFPYPHWWAPGPTGWTHIWRASHARLLSKWPKMRSTGAKRLTVLSSVRLIFIVKLRSGGSCGSP